MGISNLVGGLTSSFPVGGSFSRSSVAVNSGAQTQLSNIITASLMILVIQFLTPCFYYLPKATLGAVVFVAVFHLIDISEYIRLWKVKRADCIVSLIAFIGTSMVGIEYGIVIAVVASILRVFKRVTMPYYARLGQIEITTATNRNSIDGEQPGTLSLNQQTAPSKSIVYRNIKRCPDAKLATGVEIFKFDSMIFFGNSFQFNTMVLRFLSTPHVHTVVLDLSSIPNIDSQAIHMFEGLYEYISELDVSKRIYFSNVSDNVMDVFDATNLTEKYGDMSFFHTIHDAVVAAQKSVPLWYRVDEEEVTRLEEGTETNTVDEQMLVRRHYNTTGALTVKSFKELNSLSVRSTREYDGTVRCLNVY